MDRGSLPALVHGDGHQSAILSYHDDMKRWSLDGDFCSLKSVAKGQEFVFDASDIPESLDWIKALLRRKSESLLVS